MEENKYYTPEISEFFVGFEVEVNHKIRNGSGERSWSKEKFRMSEENVRFTKYLLQNEPENIRVKYLDKEDILDLGFTFFGENNETLIKSSVKMYHNDELNTMLGHYYEVSQIVIATKDPSKNEIFCKTGQDPNRTGFLKIKNKSELQKLLKQLDI